MPAKTKRVTYFAQSGPNFSHIGLRTRAFDRLRDARDWANNSPFPNWRIIRGESERTMTALVDNQRVIESSDESLKIL